MSKTADVLMTIAFIAISAFFAVAAFFVRDVEAGRESLSAKPSLRLADGSVNLDFTNDISDYFADNFAFRQNLIDLNSKIMTMVLSTSPVEKVVFGKDGWLFFSDTLGDYLGTSGMTRREVYSAARSLYLMQEYSEGQGAAFLFVPVPNKNTVYGEYMPYERAAGDSSLVRLFGELEGQGVKYIDLRKAFEREEILYLKADSHWNMLGAAIAADTINAALNVKTVFESEMSFTAAAESGDLFEMLYPTSNWTEPDYEYLPGFGFEYQSMFRSAEDISIATVRDGATGSLLMFRDSFGNSLYSFMAESYGSAFFSRANSRLDFIEQKQADFVIVELVERNLAYLIGYAPIFPAPERMLTETAQIGAINWGISEDEQSKLTGFVKLTGWISDDCIDDDSPVYIDTGSAVYEAIPAGKGESGYPFTLYLPESAVSESYAIVVYHEGALKASN